MFQVTLLLIGRRAEQAILLPAHFNKSAVIVNNIELVSGLTGGKENNSGREKIGMHARRRRETAGSTMTLF